MTDLVITLAIHGTVLWLPRAATIGPRPMPLIGELRFREVFLAPISAPVAHDCPMVADTAWRLPLRRR